MLGFPKALSLMAVGIALASTLLSCGSVEGQHETPLAVGGILEVPTWQWEADTPMALDGQWEMYWGQLLEPGQFAGKTPMLFKVPGLWNGVEWMGSELPGEGYATFRLRVRLDSPPPMLAINFGKVQSAYRLWANGVLVAQEGTVASAAREASPRWAAREHFFTQVGQDLELVLQVSNFHHRKGGIDSHLLLGTPEQVTAHVSRLMGFEIFLLGVLVIMALYHFGLYALRRKDFSTLFFGLVCLLTGIHSSSGGQLFFMRIFPSTEWELLLKFNFLANYLRLPAFALFVAVLFKEEVSRAFALVIGAAGGVLSLLVLVSTANFYSRTLNIFFVLAISTILYLMFGLAKASLHRREGAIYSVLGTLVLLLTAVNDILNDMQAIDSLTLLPFGLFVFIFFQSFMLSVRFSNSFISVEKLTQRLISLDKIKNEFLENTSKGLETPLRIVMANIGAYKGYLFSLKNGHWTLEAFSEKGMPSQDDGILGKELGELAQNRGESLLAFKVLREAIRLGRMMVVESPPSRQAFADDPYIQNRELCSILCMPLFNQGALKSVLYLENYSSESFFTEERVNVLDLLSSQISTIIDNSKIYQELEALNRSLEEKVVERTAEVQEQKTQIEEQSRQLQLTLDELNVKTKNQTDSIRYAQRIQAAILPTHKAMEALLPEHFVLYWPKDILSGDFYWTMAPPDAAPGDFMAAAVDCTGHGVPGALLSIVGNNLLNLAVSDLGLSKPSEVLTALQRSFRNFLNQEEQGMTASNESMDMGLVRFTASGRRLLFAGARNPLYLVRDGQLIEFKATKLSVGGQTLERYAQRHFEDVEIEIRPGDNVYLFSDGFADQFGGKRNAKLTYKRFKDLLVEVAPLEPKEQFRALESRLAEWKGQEKQTDDVLVLGMRF